MAASIRKNYPPFAEVATKNLQYAFKVRVRMSERAPPARRWLLAGAERTGAPAQLLFFVLVHLRVLFPAAPRPPHTHTQDQNNPAAWKDTTGLTILPPESDVQGNPLDAVKTFFSGDSLASLFKSS
jgi:hypothetical protein